MDFELDHVFILTEEGAPAAEILVNLGCKEGTSNVHPGQGTRNRRFFFHNAMVELLWVHNADEARSHLTTPTYLYSRWMNRATGACPFGICVKPETIHQGSYPFAGWAYHSQYLPQKFTIHVSNDVKHLQQPFLFYLPYSRKPENPPSNQPTKHAPGMNIISHIVLTFPNSVVPGYALQNLEEQGIVTLRQGDDHLMEVIFDQRTQGLSLDIRPELPLIFHY